MSNDISKNMNYHKYNHKNTVMFNTFIAKHKGL